MSERLTEPAMIACDVGLDHAGTGLVVAGQIEELGETRVRAPRWRGGNGSRGAFAPVPEMPCYRIAHQRPQLIVCHSLTST